MISEYSLNSFSFCNLWWTWQLPYGYGWTLQQFLISTVVKLFIDDDVITSFSFSSSMSSRAAMQFRVSRNARRCAVSIRECISAPTTFTHTNTTTLPTICTKINTSLGGIHNSRSPISITNCLSSSYWRFCVCSVENVLQRTTPFVFKGLLRLAARPTREPVSSFTDALGLSGSRYV